MAKRKKSYSNSAREVVGGITDKAGSGVSEMFKGVQNGLFAPYPGSSVEGMDSATPKRRKKGKRSKRSPK